MFIAIPIVGVMYFFLLPARFEGSRYAPTKLEKGTVMVLIGLLFPTCAILFGGQWPGLAFGLLVASYVLLLPVRMMFRMKIHPLEASIVIFSILAAFIIYPMLAHH